MVGRIIKGVGNFFDVYVEEDGEFKDKIIACNSRGIFRKEGLKPLVGDTADIDINYEHRDKTEIWGIIKKIGDRKNFLRRPPVANLDVLFIVTSVRSPAPSYFFIDKLTVTAVENNITPVIIVNKIDLGDGGDEIYRIYSSAGFKTVRISAGSIEAEMKPESGEIRNMSLMGLEEIKNEMKNAVCAFAGASGVGKSSILNRLFLNLNLDTGVLSNKIERGKHTTRVVELFKNNLGGYAADTPGFGALDFESGGYIPKGSLVSAFPDLNRYAGNCRYTKCTHIKEDGCGVMEALRDGKVSASRHESYSAVFEILRNQRIRGTEKSKEKAGK